MIYHIEFRETANKDIFSLKDKELIKNIINKIGELRYNPTKGKHLFKNCYELKAKNYRVYYFIYKGILVIAQIEYAGKVRIERLGTKDSQERDIQSLK